MAKIENMNFHFHLFSGSGTFQGPSSFQKQFYNQKIYLITGEFFLVEPFDIFLKIKKTTLFLIVFFKSCASFGRGLF